MGETNTSKLVREMTPARLCCHTEVAPISHQSQPDSSDPGFETKVQQCPPRLPVGSKKRPRRPKINLVSNRIGKNASNYINVGTVKNLN